MPERIATAEIRELDANALEIDDRYPGTYGFDVRLSCDPGAEWGVEFESVYEGAAYPGKPPVEFLGDHLRVYYLPRYANDLPRFLRFLNRMVAETNGAVEKRNSVLPNEDQQREDFLVRLRAAAREALS